jgi:GT2 family glycosyltransferase
MVNKTAVIVVSHNNRDLTDALCRNVQAHVKRPHDLFVIETGSKLEKMSTFATFWVKDGIRMTRGFNWGIRYALWKERMDGDVRYDSFWLCVNDAKLFNCDTLTAMVDFMNAHPDCGQIHPFIDNSGSPLLRKMNQAGARKVSFVEIVCPLVSRAAIDAIPGLLDDDFFYGWGLDYEMPYLLHKNGFRTYLSDDVGVVHDAGTTVKTGNDGQLKTVHDQFAVSRANMTGVLKKKYGEHWARHFLDSIPPDVSKDSLLVWMRDIARDLQ